MEETKEQILDNLKRTAKAISLTFGSSCETLIHDMKAPGHPIVAILPTATPHCLWRKS